MGVIEWIEGVESGRFIPDYVEQILRNVIKYADKYSTQLQRT